MAKKTDTKPVEKKSKKGSEGGSFEKSANPQATSGKARLREHYNKTVI